MFNRRSKAYCHPGLQTASNSFESIHPFKSKVSILHAQQVREKFQNDSLLISVSNRSTDRLVCTRENKLEFRRSPGGLGPWVRIALQKVGKAIVYAAAMTEAEKRLATEKVFISQDEKIWVRYIGLPASRFDAYYKGTADLLYHVCHGFPVSQAGHSGNSGRQSEALSGSCKRRFTGNDKIHPFSKGRTSDCAPRDHTQPLRSFNHGYCWVNDAFARILLEELTPSNRDRIIIHDYHLALLPALLRNYGFTGKATLFFHIPWPNPNTFLNELPRTMASEIVKGMISSDIIGFHVHSYLNNFKDTVSALNGSNIQIAGESIICNAGGKTRRVQLLQNPFTVDPSFIETALFTDTSLNFIKNLIDKIQGRILIVRSERIDRIKGIVEGLEAFALILNRFPDLRSKIQLFAFGQQSRLEIDSYREYYRHTQQMAISINRQFCGKSGWNGIIKHEFERDLLFGKQQWPPVVVYACEKPYEEVLAAMAVADIGLFNSHVDGMNLAVKEFAMVNRSALLGRINGRLHARFGEGDHRLNPGIIVMTKNLGAYQELQNYVLSIDDSSDPHSIASELHKGMRLILDHQDKADDIANMAAQMVSQYSQREWINRLIHHDG